MVDPASLPNSDQTPPSGKSAKARLLSVRDNVIAVAFGAREKTAQALRLTADEKAFLPAAMEVVETPASPTLRLTALLICSLLAAALLWACLAHIDMVAVAPGKIVPLGQVKVVQPLETSAIRAIHVDDGDHVAAGQILVELDPTDVKADLTSELYDRGQAALDAEVARLLMTRDPQGDFHSPEGVDVALAEANHAQAVAEIEKHLAQVAEAEAELSQKQASLDANAATIERAKATLPLLEEKNTTAKTLFDKQAGARPPVLDSEQQVIEKRAELAGAQAAARQVAAEMAAAKAKRNELVSGFLAEAGDRRTKALQKLAGLEQQIAKIRQREAYRRLVSPVDGTVQNVKIHTPGAVVTTADTLMTIVPDGTGIEVEANVENKDIGFVREGQEVEVKLDAFPFTRYGLVKGKVRKLSHDATPTTMPPQDRSSPKDAQSAGNAQQQPTSDLAYSAKITLDRDWIGVEDKQERFQPGMRVSAEIKTGDRRVIDYILSPVMQTVAEAGRER
jgi:hemolysin D